MSALDLVEDAVRVAGLELAVLRPRDSEALLDEHAFEHEEFLPYWAELWPSALALARAVGTRALRGARTLELGCGLGVRAGSAEPRRGARRRARAGHRLVARIDPHDGPQRRAQRAGRRGAALLVDGAGAAARTRAVGPRARLRRPLRAPQRRGAAASAAAAAGAARGGLARRPRPS